MIDLLANAEILPCACCERPATRTYTSGALALLMCDPCYREAVHVPGMAHTLEDCDCDRY